MQVVCNFCENKFFLPDDNANGQCPHCGHRWRSSSKGSRLTIYQQIQLVELRQQGLSYYQIAQRLGCTRNTVWRRLKLAKFNTVEALLSDSEAERTLEAFKQCNQSIPKTAKARNIAWESAYGQVLRAKYLHKLRKEYLHQ
jgi:transposase